MTTTETPEEILRVVLLVVAEVAADLLAEPVTLVEAAPEVLVVVIPLQAEPEVQVVTVPEEVVEAHLEAHRAEEAPLQERLPRQIPMSGSSGP